MNYKQLRPAASLHDTLLMLLKEGEPAMVRLSRGLRIAHMPGVHLTAYRPGVMPSREEIVAVVKAARQAGLDVNVDQAAPAAWGGFAAWKWALKKPAAVMDPTVTTAGGADG